jgi:folate-binding protein YgfZ
MAVTASFETDYGTLTEGCGVVDRSERGKLALTGPDAKAFLQGQLTNDVVALAPGRGCYAAFLTAKGKMLGDVRVLDTGAEILLDTERVALQELFNMIRRYSLGYSVELHKRTLECGLLSLIGPLAETVVARAFGADAPAGAASASSSPAGAAAAAEHDHVLLPFAAPAAGGGSDERDASIGVRAIRTDVGIDLLFDAALGDSVLTAVTEAGGVPAGEEAAECLRIERGRPRYGIDLDDSVIPQEAGLNERAVSFTKGCYVGQETVARLFYKGKPNRTLRGLRSAVAIPVGAELTLDGERQVGRVTSSAVSPRLGPVALALVRREAATGDTVTAADGTAAEGIAAEVVELPFGY